MTDTKAPERIWLLRDVQGRVYVFNERGDAPDDTRDDTEYVRADLLTAAEAERDKAVAMKDALVGDKIMLRSELAAVEAERDRLRAALDEAEARVEQSAQEARAAALQEAAEVAKAWWSPTMSQGYEQAGAILALLDTSAAKTKKPDSD